GRSHDLIIDFADNPDLFHPDLASGSLLYFKMQYRREGYGDARVIPGGYINASEDYYHYAPWLRSMKDRRAPLFDVYGRFGPQFAESTRRRAVGLLKAQDRFRYEGSLGIVRYSRSLEEVARAKICIHLPGNGPGPSARRSWTPVAGAPGFWSGAQSPVRGPGSGRHAPWTFPEGLPLLHVPRLTGRGLLLPRLRPERHVGRQADHRDEDHDR